MNVRERFHRLMRFETVDRLPCVEWATWWDKTIERWKTEGLVIAPQPPLNEGQALMLQLGLDLHLQMWVNIDTARTPKPAYHGAPIIHSLAEYEALLPTLYPDQAFSIDTLRAYKRYQESGEAVFWLTLLGPFWAPRTLLGIEPHLFAFYDEPELMHRINADVARFNLRVLEQVCGVLTPDFMTFAEDMSYNNGPMVSEAIFDEFLLPYYRLQIPAFRARGIRVFIDSDGDISMAIPWFERAGIEGVLPLEKQAGVDVATLRDTHPSFLFIGNYDKMCMPHGEAAMRAEFERLLPAMRRGGFIPSVDHQTPPGVSFELYKVYVRLLYEYAEKARQIIR